MDNQNFKSFISIFSIIIIITFSCKSYNKEVTVSSGTEKLTRLQDSLFFLDLSGENLDSFPDLSRYFIEKLDISNNNISNYSNDYLPKGITSLDLSNNELSGYIQITQSGYYQQVTWALERLMKWLVKLKN